MTSATAPSGGFAAGFCEPVGEHGHWVWGSPVAWQHLIESWIIVVEAEQKFTPVGPGFNAASMAISRRRQPMPIMHDVGDCSERRDSASR
jgi:hypothetical protein